MLKPAVIGEAWPIQVTIRAASASAKVCLCLVRRANRDGHTMRSFEAAAIGGCILAEDTADHREIFGPEDYAARYFRERIGHGSSSLSSGGARPNTPSIL